MVACGNETILQESPCSFELSLLRGLSSRLWATAPGAAWPPAGGGGARSRGGGAPRPWACPLRAAARGSFPSYAIIAARSSHLSRRAWGISLPSTTAAAVVGLPPTASTPAAQASLASLYPPYAAAAPPWRASWRHGGGPAAAARAKTISRTARAHSPRPALHAAERHHARPRSRRALFLPRSAAERSAAGGCAGLVPLHDPAMPGSPAWGGGSPPRRLSAPTLLAGHRLFIRGHEGPCGEIPPQVLRDEPAQPERQKGAHRLPE